MSKLNYSEIEKKWQNYWKENKINKTSNNFSQDKNKFYILDMFPYPSGDGLHVGHPKGYIATDVYSRMKKMQGYNVLHPMGWDAFGLPAEQFAIKNKINPNIATEKNVKRYKEQIEMLGLNYDFDREINTTDPKYYKWTQWMWKQMYKDGLAFESFDPINWCPTCKTGLANEDLDGNTCERCGTVVEKKKLRQWTIRITDYADRLLADLDKLNWEPHIKELQKNWIGKSEGSEIDFEIVGDVDFVNLNTGPLTPTRGTDMLDSLQNKKNLPLYYTANIKNYEALKSEALKMRNNPTLAEEELWKLLNTEFTEYKWRRQHIIDNFISDFVCLQNGLIIEADGEVHNDQKERDEDRDNILKSKNFTVLRFTNDDILNNKDFVISKIKEIINGISATPVGAGGPVLKIFTTRADTLFGCTFMAISYTLAKEWIKDGWNASEEIKNFINKLEKEEKERTIDFDMSKLEKEGIDTGIKAINPVNGEEVPIYIANYILSDYGTGAIMAVPAHDERDYEFAKKYNLEIREVVKQEGNLNADLNINKDFSLNKNFPINNELYEGEGVLKNSQDFSGMGSEEARVKITEKVGGKIVSKYKLKDWVFARQRYWGEPFPIVFIEDENGNRKSYAVADKELPVVLPNVENYEPTDNGESPLANIKDWVEVYGFINEDGEFESVESENIKIEGKEIRKFYRETNTMPQWAGSSWYYLRYIDPKNDDEFVNKDLEKKWNPVDFYVGGAEHATRHLIYARFWHKYLFEKGYVNYDEPFSKLQTVGLIMAPDGKKMSKRYGNVVNPDDVVKEFGADAMRTYEMFMGPFEKAIAWNTNSMAGVSRFLERVYNLVEKVELKEEINDSKEIERIINETIKKVGEDIEKFGFNTAIAQLMICLNSFEEEIKRGNNISKNTFSKFIQILSPFAVHISEEIWQNILGNNNSIHTSDWPEVDVSKIKKDEIEMSMQISGKFRGTFLVKPDLSEDEIKEIVKNLDLYKKYILNEADIKKIIIVKNRLINIVI